MEDYKMGYEACIFKRFFSYSDFKPKKHGVIIKDTKDAVYLEVKYNLIILTYKTCKWYPKLTDYCKVQPVKENY